MSIKAALKYILILFCFCTTFIFFITGVIAVFISPDTLIDGRHILNALFLAFAATIPTLVFVGGENASRRGIFIRRAIHFFLTAGIIFGCLTYFEWMDATNIIYIILTFLIVYIVGTIITEIREKKLADKLNERINAFHEAQNETHHH